MKEDNKQHSDETTIFRVLRKKKKTIIIEDEDDFKNLESTREFKKVETDVENAIIRFNPKKDRGLAYSQVSERKEQGLVNKPKKRYERSYLQIIIKNIFTYLNILLFSILLILLIAQDTSITDYFFLLIIGSNLVIGIVQEIRAKKVVDKLSLETKEKVKVIREGQVEDVDASEIVLDDLIKLSLGKKIVTDSIIIDGVVEVNESLLTGESLPVKKSVGDMVFAGSFISSGSCICKAEHIGSDNYVTKLQEKAKKEKKNNSVILKSLNYIIGAVSLCVVPFAIYNFLTQWSSVGWTKNWIEIQEILKTTGSSMIALIPSGLYLTTSVSLMVSVIALAKRKTLVQDSYSIEMLARTDVLCLDKTGTITDGTMTLFDEKTIHHSSISSSILVGNLLSAFEEKNQTAKAILDVHPGNNEYKVLEKIPFSSDRKMCCAKFDKIGTYVLGAPEFVLDKKDNLVLELEEYTKQGYRVLLLAQVDDIVSNEVKGKPYPLQVYIIKDHIRKEAYDTLKWFASNDVEVKIISGDNALTVSKVAHEAGVVNAEKYISLEGLTLEQVAEAATKYTVFGRVAPEQKAMIVSALKKAHKTVAMTGDGVNDILALKIADCSIAMASGSEAARNVSSLVLVDSNFACLPKVVEEGRRVINNITEVASLFLMKTIFAFIVTLSSLYPFQPSNLLILEIFCSGIPSFLLALQPNNRKIKGGFLKNVLVKAVPGGLTYAIGVIVLVILCNNGIFNASPDNAATIAATYITLMAVITLLFHCLPLNKFRIMVFVSMSIVAICMLFIPITSNNIVKLNQSALNTDEWIMIFVAFIIGIIVFIGSKMLVEFIIKKCDHGKKH
ncbi:MAG: HAD-IC family P-type ATPase [Bacillales bacterium]|nr:HAD-IC family P-type ATPase [Bacillales bacterium]